MNFIDSFLNKITMYRLVVYGLLLLVAAGFWFSVSGRLQFTPLEMVVSLSILLSSVYVTEFALAKVWRVPRNSESWLITALILFLILQPDNTWAADISLAVAGVVASASKYLISWNGKQVFNPAAFAAAFLSITAIDPATWWIGNAAAWPIELIIGLTIVRKIRRFQLVVLFALVSIVAQAIVFWLHNQPIISGMSHALIASPLIFLATIMLTEPATMPPRNKQRFIFSSGIAVLYVIAPSLGPFVVYPEVALLLGNAYAFVVSPKYRVRMQLTHIQKISERVYNYVFQPDRRIDFLPGQYMEWTLPNVPFDNRGNRRTFTIASSPTESTIQIGLKYYDPPSMFKYTFSKLEIGDYVYASQLAGNFTLNGAESYKLVFIAGGIGITPFRSMVKYILDNEIQSDITLLYVVTDPTEFAYANVFREAQAYGIKVITITSKQGNYKNVISAKLSSDLIANLVPDYNERIFYISGSNSMVEGTKDLLHNLAVEAGNIKTDYFSGY